MLSVFSPRSSQTGERQPLLRPLSQPTVGSLCFVAVLLGLVVAWCLLNEWNLQVSDTLFHVGDIRMITAEMHETPGGRLALSSKEEAPFGAFTFPLTLAFCQFFCMGLLFLVMYLAFFRDRASSFTNLADLYCTMDKRRWPLLVFTHVSGMFFLQGLMLPKQVMSVGLFATTKAIEIPVAAGLRSPVCGKQIGQRTMVTVVLATVAACTMYFAYARMADCMCVWTGHGIMLSGFPFWLLYLLVLVLPAANLVLQEGVMDFNGTHPVLMLAFQNIFACGLISPVLMVAHLTGWENVWEAMKMITGVPEVTLLVGWLCLQMSSISLVCAMLVQFTDSFWAVALQSMRVVWWSLGEIWSFYNAAPGRTLSISAPTASSWLFLMFCGFCLALVAVYVDRKAEDSIPNKQASKRDAPIGRQTPTPDAGA